MISRRVLGGLITRYTLASMETDFHEDEHQKDVYFSFDTPHRGVSIPDGVQAFAYLLPYGLGLKPHPRRPEPQRSSRLHQAPVRGQALRPRCLLTARHAVGIAGGDGLVGRPGA